MGVMNHPYRDAPERRSSFPAGVKRFTLDVGHLRVEFRCGEQTFTKVFVGDDPPKVPEGDYYQDFEYNMKPVNAQRWLVEFMRGAYVNGFMSFNDGKTFVPWHRFERADIVETKEKLWDFMWLELR